MQFEIAIRASQGARRAQEDTALSWPLPATGSDSTSLMELPLPVAGEAVAVLCDGMGGHAGGAMAGRLAAEAFLANAAGHTGTARDRLYQSLELANATIAAKIVDNSRFRGMGSTLVAVHLGPDGLSWVSVGDSLLYLWRGGKIVPLNADHSLAPEIDKLAESGKITWAQAQADPRRHYLRSALTGDDIEMIDLSERVAPLLKGDVVVLASDGIHTLGTDEIALVVSAMERHGASPIAARLLSLIEAAGAPHQDNTTVIVIKILDAGQPLSAGHV